MINYKQNVINNGLKNIADGVNLATNVVRKTMGPKGVNVAIEMDDFPFFACTNDGATIIDKMDFQHPAEKIGLNAIKEACSRSNANAGDGSTTTCVLLDAILQEGIKSGATGMEIKNSLDTLLPEVIKLIDEQKKDIDVHGVKAVATIAGESEELGSLLSDVYQKIGKDGIIHLEGSGTYETSYEFIDGVRFASTGFLSPYMVHDEQAIKEKRKETKAVYKNPTILVTKQKIATLNDINPILETLHKQDKKDLVIFTDDMDSGVASILIKAHKEKIFNILIIKAPVIMKNAVFEDFARCTSSTIVEDSSGITLKTLPLSAFGTCAEITCDENECVLIGTADITDHAENLRTKQDIESQMRLSWLTPKTVLLKLGSLSETDLYYKRLKCEDAIYSSRLALQDGIVNGGGMCLKKVSEKIDNLLLKAALQAPYNQIKSTGVVYPLHKDIVDSAMIVKQAVKNAIGIASTLLTISDIIVRPEETPDQIAFKMMNGNGSRPF